MHREAPSALGSLLEREVLPLVAKPHRYIGHEIGAVRKEWDAVRARFLFCYPDAYEVGMSHVGTQILYHVVNRRPHLLMERAYAPWPDMEGLMRQRGIPLFSLESRHAVREFDVVGFTLQSELTYTNILTMLDLAGIPLRQADRGSDDPLVIAGGPGASNPEPLASFVDAFVIGDAEEALPELLEIVGEWKQGMGGSGPQARHDVLFRLATGVPGVYVPSLYSLPPEGGTPLPTDPRLPFPVRARVVPALRPEDHPHRMLVPLTEVTHERLPIEVQRGCVRGCRFCQAGYLYRPVRERGVGDCTVIAEEGLEHGGNEEISLLSLSTADHSQIGPLVDRVSRVAAARGAAVALPSLRADAFSAELAEATSRVRRTGFTFAIEAGSERLRRVINKGLGEADILAAVERALASGWSGVKLYLMIGHPTEGEADYAELSGLVSRIREILARHPRTHVTLSVSPLTPKPQTPFQWERQDAPAETAAKLRWIRRRLSASNVDVKHNDLEGTLVEGMISRGGRETAALIEGAWRRGARFDGWTEHLRPGAWAAALADLDQTIEERFRERGEDEPLPWEVVSYGVPRKWFLRERRKAYAEALTEECRSGPCSGCGVCDFDRVQNVFADAGGVGGRVSGVEKDAPVELHPAPYPLHPSSWLRFRYAKGSAIRFLSHLDVIREIIRTFRRADVRMVYSTGFMPRPRVSAGPALATGWTSSCEYLDLELAGEWDDRRLATLLGELNRRAAPGLAFQAAGVVAPHRRSLGALIERSAYRATFPEPPFEPAFAERDAGCRAFLSRDVVRFAREREGRKHEVDLRPFVYDLAALDGATVLLELRTASDGSAKPTEVLEAACGVPSRLAPLVNIHKTATWLANGRTPLDECPVAAGDKTVETGDFDQWEPAGNPCGHSGGRRTR